MIKFVYILSSTRLKCEIQLITIRRITPLFIFYSSSVAAGDEEKKMEGKGFIIKSKLCVLSFFIQFSRHAQHVVHYLHHHHLTLRQILFLPFFHYSLFINSNTFIIQSDSLFLASTLMSCRVQ